MRNQAANVRKAQMKAHGEHAVDEWELAVGHAIVHHAETGEWPESASPKLTILATAMLDYGHECMAAYGRMIMDASKPQEETDERPEG